MQVLSAASNWQGVRTCQLVLVLLIPHDWYYVCRLVVESVCKLLVECDEVGDVDVAVVLLGQYVLSYLISVSPSALVFYALCLVVAHR